LRDCSATEERLGEFFTVLYDNSPEPGQSRVSGITFKGIKHLFTQWEMPLEGVYLVADLLDRAVKELIKEDDCRDQVEDVKMVKDLAATIELPVTMAA